MEIFLKLDKNYRYVYMLYELIVHEVYMYVYIYKFYVWRSIR